MAKVQTKRFRTVETNENDYKEKLRRHRLRMMILFFSLITIIVIAVVTVYIKLSSKEYTEFEELYAVERSDTAASQFVIFDGNLLKYTNDGASYTDNKGTLIWNQAYEMNHPQIATRKTYSALYDRGGNQIYILDTVGLKGSIKTTVPIQRVSIAAQGTIAVLMEQNGTSYLQLYDKSGTQLAAGEIHVENSGFALDISISDTGEKMVVSMIDINEGNVKTILAFYNFGRAGESEIDKIVGSFSYSNELISRVVYLDDDKVVAFGDQKVILLSGTQKPVEDMVIPLKEEVRSIFYNNQYFGLVFDNAANGDKYRMDIYDCEGTKVLEQSFALDYNQIEFLENQEICITNENQCDIYTLKGVHRYHGTFDERLYKVLSGTTQIHYTLILDGVTKRIQLK